MPAEMEAQKIIVPVGDERVSGLLLRPTDARALYLIGVFWSSTLSHVPSRRSNTRVR